eukprot:m.128087 g.128087  ORF g.128087 m.128087 type:complete len:350 (+) comp37943_c0_seq7:57-1106(+)
MSAVRLLLCLLAIVQLSLGSNLFRASPCSSSSYPTVTGVDCLELANCNCSLDHGTIYCKNLTDLPDFKELASPSLYKTLRIVDSTLGNITSPSSFASLTQLRTLIMTNSEILEMSNVFQEMCKIDRDLESLNLFENQLAAVPDGLEYCTYLTEICLGANEMTSSGLRPYAFHSMKGLKELDLSHNHMLSIGAHSLAFSSPVLQSVYMDNCGIQTIDSQSGISKACETTRPPKFYLSVGNDFICNCSLSWMCNNLESCIEAQQCSDTEIPVDNFCKMENCKSNSELRVYLGAGIGILFAGVLIGLLVYCIWKSDRCKWCRNAFLKCPWSRRGGENIPLVTQPESEPRADF